MKINRQDLFKIIDNSKTNFVEQHPTLMWKSEKGYTDLSFEEKRFVSMLEAVNQVLQLGLEVDCTSEILELAGH